MILLGPLRAFCSSPTMELSRLIRILRSPPYAAGFCTSSTAAGATTRLLKIGDVLKESRRFTDADLVGYSEVSGDRNPIHFDAEFARRVAGLDRGKIVHGMLVASLFPSLIASHFPGAIYVSQSLQFRLPVYIEDEVVTEVQVTKLREIKKRYLVKFSTKCFTDRDCIVLDGEATTILPTLTLNN